MTDSLTAKLLGSGPLRLAYHSPEVQVFAASADLEPPVDMNDVDFLLRSTALRLPYIAMSGNGRPVSPLTYSRPVTVLGAQLAGVPSAERVYKYLSMGKTLILFRLNDLLPRVYSFCDTFGREMGHPVDFGLYVTPAGQQALRTHADQEDVVIWQLYGSKHWRWWPRRPDYQTNYVYSDDMGPPVVEATLRRGDVIYMPRGTPHQVESVEEFSVHATIGLKVPTIGQVLLAEFEARAKGEGWTGDSYREDVDLTEVWTRLAEELGDQMAGVPRSPASPIVDPPKMDSRLKWAVMVGHDECSWEWSSGGPAFRREVDRCVGREFGDLAYSLPQPWTEPQLAQEVPEEGWVEDVRLLVLAGFLVPFFAPKDTSPLKTEIRTRPSAPG